MAKAKTPKSRAVAKDAPKKRRSSPNVYDRTKILDFYHANGRNQTLTASFFKVNGFPNMNQSTVSRMVHDEARWRTMAEKNVCLDAVRVRSVRHPRFDAALSIWVDQMEAARFNGLTSDVIRAVAMHVYEKLEIPEHERTSLSNGWIDAFKSRNGLRFHRFHGEAASISAGDVASERARVQALLTSAFDNGYDINDIFNFDETGSKQSKTRITLALGTNATGTDKLPPLFIGHAKKPRCFSAPPQDIGYDYASSEKAWMTGDIFRAWMLRLQATMASQGRHIILLVDNFSGHKSDEEATPNVRLEFFRANLTAHEYLLSIVPELYDGVIKNELFKINQKMAMDFALAAWGKVKKDTIINCWGHTNILPGEKRATCCPITEMDELSAAMHKLTVAAITHSMALDVPTAEEYVDAGETDDLALLSYLTIDQICDFVRYVDDDDDTNDDDTNDDA
ncbi:tigger transposable element-derived protein 6-like [Achlya hypogyna]|uniref:Tigger transposable element-derived protein 6-like n=1 Tax=Achlya hypogyna TaxID=1202772 RepID=A0A1V9YPL1_ACHHY|nr:tigger transposable element-derived protein 6-like [Achlya hypogyna]